VTGQVFFSSRRLIFWGDNKDYVNFKKSIREAKFAYFGKYCALFWILRLLRTTGSIYSSFLFHGGGGKTALFQKILLDIIAHLEV
jgi:hypothetical protein